MVAMRRVLPGGGFGFWLHWDDFEPSFDPAWSQVTARTRQAFREELTRVAMATWKKHRAAGEDRYGDEMTPIGPGTVVARLRNRNRVTALKPYSPMGRADITHAPLQSTGARSRTQSLLRVRFTDEGAWFYWAMDRHTGYHWGAILDRHRRGFTQYFRYPKPEGFRRVPSRDVFGFGPAEVTLISRHMARWWMPRRGNLAPMRLAEVPDVGLEIALPAPLKVLAPEKRRYKPEPLPKFTTITAQVSAVSGTGGGELGAGTKIARFAIGSKAPAWMRRGKR